MFWNINYRLILKDVHVSKYDFNFLLEMDFLSQLISLFTVQ